MRPTRQSLFAGCFVGLLVALLAGLLVWQLAGRPPGKVTPSTGALPSITVPSSASPSPTPTSTPTVSLTPTLPSSPTLTPTPTATDHPMFIVAMRRTPYPGSDITIEETLAAGANYERYFTTGQN